MKLKNVFTSGKMNKDSDERLIQKGEYRHALNVRVANSNGSDVGAVENALSNAKMSSINFGSNAKTIGTVEDDAANKIYWCVVSDNGSFVCEFSKESNQASVIISDNRAGDLNQLGFTPSNMVDMSILNDAENNKNFLFLTDGVTEPKYFEVDTAKALANNTFTFEDVSLIKAPPITAPTLSLKKTNTEEENYIQTKFFSFAYRYIYENDEISAISPFSEFAFMPDEFRYDYNSGNNKSMQNKYNKAVVSFNTGSKNVKKIEILAKQSGDDITYIVEKLDKEDKEWSDNSTQTFTFTNSKVYKALPESQLRRVYDNVPRKAKTLEIIGNRVVFGNYTENYNIGDIPKLNLTYSSTTGSKGTPHQTIKSNMDYEVGISYIDGKGRMTTPFTSEDNTVHVPIIKSDNKNTLSVEVSSQAPDWASGYKFFIKQSKNDYDVISPVVFYKEGPYAYIKIEGEDINKVKEGDFLFIKSDTSGIRKKPIKVKVLESENKERNFLEGTTNENTIQESGNYIKVDTEQLMLDETSIDTFAYEGYAFRAGADTRNDFLSPVDYIDSPVFYGQGTNDLTASGSYTGATDTRYEIEISSTGTTDQVRWRSLDCKENALTSWSAPTNISGSLSMSNGVSVSFGTTTGHTVEDRWIVNAKSFDRAREWDRGDDPDVGDDGRRAIMLFKCKTSSGESIKSGAIITLEYDDSRSDKCDNTVGYSYQRFVSSADYDNIEEWFWEDNVISKMEYPEDITDIMFRRGSLSKANGEQMTINPSGDLFMAILSPCNYTGGGRVRIDLNFRIMELDNPIILETDYKFASSEVFYELPKTYGISNGNHLGDVNQVFGTTNALVNLDHFNAFGWYNGYESIKIADGFNQSRMILDSKPLVPLDNYKEITRVASLTYSGIYESTTSFNGVNEFNLSTANYKDLDPSFGKIAKIISRNGDLTVIQNNRVSRVLYSKSVIYNADGSGNVSQNNNVLGQEVPYQGEFGISNNIYAATKWNGDIYFADERRGSVIRLTDNGIFPISTYGMISWFNDHLYVGSNIVSSFDPNNDQFVLSISNPNIEWVEDTYECEEYITTTTTSNVTTTTTQCFVDVELPIDACAIEWIEDTYSCGSVEWNEDSYECVTTTTTTEAPTVTWLEETYECNIEGTTTTSTAAPTTTTTSTTSTTTAAPTVTWIEDTYECNIEGTTTTSTAAPTTTTTSTAAPTTTTTSTAAPTTTTTTTLQFVTPPNVAGFVAQDVTESSVLMSGVIVYLGDPAYDYTIQRRGFFFGEGSGPRNYLNSEIIDVDPGDGNELNETFYFTKTGLQPSTTYGYNTFATYFDQYGERYSSTSVKTFTTLAAPTVTWLEETYECNIEGTTTTSTAAPTTTTTSTAAPTTTTTSTAAPTTTTTSTAAPTTTTTSTAAPTTTTTSTAAPTTTTTSTAAPTTTTTSTAAPTTTTTSTAAPTTTTTSTAAPTTTTTSTAAPTTTTTSTAAPTTTTTTEQPCNCVTVDVLNTQLTSGGLDLYYIYNSCGSGETSVNLNTYFGIEQNGSTYFAFCQTGSSSNMYKYGPSGNAFVGLEGMNTVPNTNTCNSDFDCSPVVPTTTTTSTAAPTTTTTTTAAPTTTTTTTTQIPSGTLLNTYCDGTTKMGTYADGGGGSYTNAIEFNSVDCGYVTPAGTLLSTYCDGTTKMGTYANGSGGSYNQVIEYNSTDCGYVYPAGTLLDTNCFGYDLWGTYADGSGGTYTDLIETNSTSCGYTAPTTTAAPTTTTTTAAPTTTTTTTAAPTTTTTTTAAPTTTTTTTAAPTTTTTTTAAPTTTTTTVALNPTCHEVTYDSSVYGLDQNRYGIAYVDYQGNFVTARFNDMLASVNASELIYYICADTVSQDVWDVNNNVAVPQYNPSLVSYNSGESCDGFCSPPGGGGF